MAKAKKTKEEKTTTKKTVMKSTKAKKEKAGKALSAKNPSAKVSSSLNSSSTEEKNKTTKKKDNQLNKKTKLPEELLFHGFDPDMEIYFYQPSDKDLSQYSASLENQNDINFSLNQFLSRKYNPKQDRILIADLRDMEISSSKKDDQFNLRGANFRGAIFKNTQFVNCDLTNAYFSDTNLRGVRFRFSDLTHVDLRGCILESCKFGKEYMKAPFDTVSSIKLSMSESELRIFADIKNEIARKNEEQRLIDLKRYEVRDVSKNTSIFTKLAYFLGMNIEEGPYKKVMRELHRMEEGIFDKKYIVHKSVENLLENDLCSFYPVFGKAFKDMKKIRHKKYVKLTREDIEEFVAITDKKINLSLNQFAKMKFLATQVKGYVLPEETMIVADLSSKVNKFGNNEWNRMNLSGISFIERDMSFVNFSGTDLSKCNFSSSNLHGANLDCCNLLDSIFTATDLTDCSMVGVDLSGSVLENVTLVRSNISWSNLTKVKILDSDISYINFHDSDLNRSYFENVVVDGSNLDHVNFEKSKFLKCSFEKTSFIDSKWSAIKMDSTKFNGSIFNYAEMKNSIWDNVELRDVEAINVDLTGSKFSQGSLIANSIFRGSLLDGIKASLCQIIDSDFDDTKIGYGKFGGADLSRSTFRFSDFNSVIMAECTAEEVDFSGAKLFNTRLVKTNLRYSIFSGARIIDCDMSGANFENSNWFNLSLITSIIENINNHRIKINDSTMIERCFLKNLEGQFYHYDEDDFIDIMFIEQQQMHQQLIQNILKTKKFGMMLYIMKLFTSEYNITRKDRNTIIKSRRRNRIDLKNHFRDIREKPKPLVDLDKFRVRNLIASHNMSK